MVVVEPVMKSKDRGREKSKLKAVRRKSHESCGPSRSSSLFHKLPGIGNAGIYLPRQRSAKILLAKNRCSIRSTGFAR